MPTICEYPPTRRECNDANVVSSGRGSGCSGVVTEHDFVEIWDISMRVRIEANGTLTTTVDGKVYLQPANRT